MDDRLYFRQLLSGRDFATHDQMAAQMVNFAYLIGDTETREAVVVDPAYDVKGLLRLLDEDDMTLTGALVTHHHPDHVGGSMGGMTISGLRELLTLRPVPVHVHADEKEWVRRVTGLEESDFVSHDGGDTLDVGDVPVEVVHTPGHTPGSQCFLVENRLVAGDTLFLDGCGRTDFPGGDTKELYYSITQRLAKVPDDAVLYPGHMYSAEASAPMGEVRRSNVVYRVQGEEQFLMMFGVG